MGRKEKKKDSKKKRKKGRKEERKKEIDKGREKFANTLFKIEVEELERNKGTKKRST